MKSFKGIASGLVALSVLGMALSPVSAKTEPKMSSSKMSSTKMSSSKMTKKSPSTQMTGTILSMTSTSLTVKPVVKSFGARKTVMVPASAKIMMGAVPTKLSNLKAGEKVTILMSKGVVTNVRVIAAKKTTKGTTMKSKMAPKMSGKKM